jgi:hypothetical protein
MNELDVLLGEYNNLWQEKIVHKQSLRKLKGYLSYLTSIISLSLTFLGMSATDIFNSVVNNGSSSSIASNFSNIFPLISIPFTPIVLIIASFALNDLFQIYVIGTHIGNIEKKFNVILNNSNLLTWEHKICPVIYGGKRLEDHGEKLTNIISWNDIRIFFPFVISLCAVTLYFGGDFILGENKFLFWVYVAIVTYLIFSFVQIGLKLFKYTKADSTLTTTLTLLNTPDDIRGHDNSMDYGE